MFHILSLWSFVVDVWGILNVTLSNNFLKLLEGLRRSFSPLVFGILDFPAHQFSWCTCNTKATRWNHRLTPHPHFLDRELIHWTDEAENMWKIVGQLPIKAGWWNTSLTFKRFNQSIANTPNYKNSKIKPSISPLIGRNKNVHNIRIAELIYVLLSQEANSNLCGWTRPC